MTRDTDPGALHLHWLGNCYMHFGYNREAMFDGGSPITAYTVYVNGTLVAEVAPQPCLNSYTFTVTPPADIWITASNCVPNATSGCTTLTSGQSNRVAVG